MKMKITKSFVDSEMLRVLESCCSWLTQSGQDITATMPDFGEHVDINTFSQILEMDEESHDFSMPLVVNFFEQADETFEKMDAAL